MGEGYKISLKIVFSLVFASFTLTFHFDFSCGFLISGDAAVLPCILRLDIENGHLSQLSLPLHLILSSKYLFRQQLSLSLPLHRDSFL